MRVRDFFLYFLHFLLVSGLLSAAAAAVGKARRRADKAEGALIQERVRLEALARSLPDAIVMTSLRGEVVALNEPALAVLGIRPEETLRDDQGLHRLTEPDRLRLAVQAILEKHTRAEAVELEVVGPEGSRLRSYRTTVSLLDPPGSEVGVLLMLRDVTAERELPRMKEEFFQAVAHDLRAPIFAIQGYLRLLEKSTVPDAKAKGFFEAIYQSCEKLTLFVQDILDSTRLEAGQLKLAPGPVDLRVMLERIRRVYAAVSEEKGLRVELRAAPDLPASVQGDERLLERVFHNLVSNALKFTPRGGLIALDASRIGSDLIEVSVRDTGPGIPKEKRHMVFERFSRLGAERQRTGFGLGLSICRRIVELHGGRIWVESEAGKGSQFIFRLPLTGPADRRTEVPNDRA